MAAKTARSPKAKVTTNVDATSLHVSLPQMLDLALGTPEVGAMNLSILHNFLHVLLHQVKLRTTKVEYRGEDANRVKAMVSVAKAGPTLHLHEYSITDGSGKEKHRFQSTDDLTVNVEVIRGAADAPSSVKESKTAASAPPSARGKLSRAEGKSMHDLSRISDTKDPKESRGSKELNEPRESRGSKEVKELKDLKDVKETKETKTKKSKGVKQEIRGGVEGEGHTVIYVEPIIDGAAPTALGFKQLDESVKHLQERFQALEELSTNAELLERLKGKITDPLTDVWQVINLTKRLDAAEQGIDKLTTMLQDVIKGDVTLGTGEGGLNERFSSIEKTLADIEQSVRQSTGGVSVGVGSVEHKVATSSSEAAEEDAKEGHESISVSHDSTDLQGTVNALKAEMSQVRKDIYDMKVKIDHAAGTTEAGTDAVPTMRDSSASKGTATAESKPTDRYMEAIQRAETTLGDALQELKGRLETLEKNVTGLTEKFGEGRNDSSAGDGGLNDLVSKIQAIQGDMEKLGETAEHLLEDRESREQHINALLEQVELLKTVKADKEDLEDALADKADAQVLNRKVSHDQFDAACDDLARGLEDAISKMGKQEYIWQQALDDVQREIESKVDKIEMTPLKDFVNNRLKTLQEKLKTVADLRRENEAAGTKKMLRDVQCISCDKNAVMRMEESGKFYADPLPCSTSMKPYLSYELDQVRKQQRRLPHSRNMIQFEAAMQEEARKIKSARDDPITRTPRDHLCNRYCGGKHTITTPQQRVTRVGHFLQQWGPQVVQLTDVLVKGTDGEFYRGRRTEEPDVCGPCDVTSDIQQEDQPQEPQPPQSPRKVSQVKRESSTIPQRLSSKKMSGLIPEVEVKEHVMERIPSIPVQEGEDEVPIDPTAHSDELQFDREEVEQGENYNA